MLTVLKRIFEYIQIFEYFLLNIDIRIWFVDIFRIWILFEYSNILVQIFRNNCGIVEIYYRVSQKDIIFRNVAEFLLRGIWVVKICVFWGAEHIYAITRYLAHVPNVYTQSTTYKLFFCHFLNICTTLVLLELKKTSYFLMKW